ncbi:MAG: hypothetical protein KGO82_16995 [Bacteroidota bacterium]|nr:hypothetical protein [Bacteroidota bacterium]
MMPVSPIAVLYHIFYEDTCETICKELTPLIHLAPDFYFNICHETPDSRGIAAFLKQYFPQATIIITSNKGKDIGGKLSLISLLLALNRPPEYLLLLHDKKSLQALKSARWKKDLLKIIEPKMAGNILARFNNTPSCGISATGAYVLKEPVADGCFSGKNGAKLELLCKKYQLCPPNPRFVAGTMFWARALPLLDFFRNHDPLAIRATLECGNVIDNFSGTTTHAWERLLSWIITSKGLSIYPV